MSVDSTDHARFTVSGYAWHELDLGVRLRINFEVRDLLSKVLSLHQGLEELENGRRRTMLPAIDCAFVV